MHKVAVLIAAYNAEKYLAACMDSLLSQTMTDFEAICVDDGSTDTTYQILQQYAGKDDRVRVVRLEENGGQAAARNVALEMSDSEYVCMLDSDDWLSDDALEQACEVLDTEPETDCVLFQVVEMYDDHQRTYPLPDFYSLSGPEAFEKSLTWQIHGLYMVRSELHKRFPYDTTTRAYSDDNTTRLHYLYSGQVRQCSGTYFYRQHTQSVTHGVSVRRFDYLRANESMKRQMEEMHTPARIMRLYERVRWLNLIDTYMFYFQHRKQLAPEEAAYGLNEIRRVWKNVDTRELPWKLKAKPGYMPLKPFFSLFRAQEETYFFLRRLVKEK